MCGIVGITGQRDVVDRLMNGLSRLEYRGYDSAGIAVAVDGQLQLRRAPGRLEALSKLLDAKSLMGKTGIAHTRWATHGQPNEANAHPHLSGGVAIVHNGIIENFQALKQKMREAGRLFSSDTDSEVIAQLLADNLDKGMTTKDAFSNMLDQLEGAFAIAAVFADKDGLMMGARRGSPLVLGYGEGEMYLGSDAIALAPLTREVTYLEEGDWVEAYPESFSIYDKDGCLANRPRVTSKVNATMVELGEFDHFMRKEIFEQSEAIARSISPYIDQDTNTVICDDDLMNIFAEADRAACISCGTSNFAGQTAKYWFEQISGLSIETDIASEYRYRKPVLPKSGPAIFISQSGETADTLAAQRYCKLRKTPTVAIVNVAESSIAREAAVNVETYAGPEIGVASTKAFTAQLAVMAILATAAGKARGHIDDIEEKKLLEPILALPRIINKTLKLEAEIKIVAKSIAEASSALFLGRGVYYPMALEGALKLKEVSYIHAEGYAAGELKHGPIALIEEGLPVIVIAPSGPLFEKTLSNMAEIEARGARIILLTDSKGKKSAGKLCSDIIEMPDCTTITGPIITAVVMQLLAYHVALAKGTDIDKPRNLAKSVTVE